jgi:diguanylate cyclase (GGDEF)-like protein/PAS domain S-box-containing protein
MDCPLRDGRQRTNMGTGQIQEALTNPTPHQDLRARKDPLQELTRKREQLECIVNCSPAVAFRRRVEEGWPVEFVSENIRQFGYSPEDFYSGRITYCNIIHPDDLKRVTTELSQCNRQQGEGGVSLEYRIVTASGEERWLDDRTWATRSEDGQITHYQGIGLDITERKKTEQKLAHDAFYDEVTTLPNRALFLDRLRQTIRSASRSKGSLFAVILLDLNRFRVVNNSLGPRIGAQLLCEAARRLQASLRAGDTVARLGGDRFTILLHEINEVSDTIRVAERIQKKLGLPLNLGGQDITISASMGIVLSAPDYEQPEDILRDADIALHRAKTSGEARHEVFDRAMHESAIARLQLENDLRRAVEGQEFRVQYQPIVSLRTGRIVGFEALVRWHHPERGIVSPLDFIPLAEETGMIVLIGQCVLCEACCQASQWQAKFSDEQPLSISVNLSSKQFSQPDLVDQIKQVLKKSQLEAKSLTLEITESVVMENAEAAAAALMKLKTLGVQLSVDDFGTGYSSLSYLHSFPINSLKIDRSFIGKMSVDNTSLEIVRTVVALAYSLGMNVTAEGIETAEQLAQLRALQCQYGQGFLFSKPLDSEAAAKLLSSQPQW